tara:strand:- start:1002 stop:2228 length:1227 start_codon:yes stop_codon:yes gene_type:complete
MFIVYNLIYIAVLPILIVRDFFKNDVADIGLIAKRFGLGLGRSNESHIWLHGVSLGEIKTLTPVANSLLNKNRKILLTTTTNTGYQQLLRSFNNNKNVKILPFPYDIVPVYRKFINRFNIHKIILFESEFWPNLLFQKSKKLKIISFNTTLSDKTFSKYSSLKIFSKKILSSVDKFFVQSLEMKKQLENFEIDQVQVIGNIKLYKETYNAETNTKNKIKEKIRNFSGYIVTAGSTHKDEEEFIISSLNKNANRVIFLAPRHPERFKEVGNALDRSVFKWAQFSKIHEITNEDIILFDEVGSLFELYKNSNLAIVAGSICFEKGHNILEPIFAGTPAITGDKLDNYKEIKSIFCDSKIIETFKTSTELAELIDYYEKNENRVKRLDLQVKELNKHGDGYEKIIQQIDEI